MKKFTFLLNFLFIFFLSVQAQQWGDYTYYSTSGSSLGYLVDTNGTTYHTYNFASNAKTGYSAYVIPGGTVVRTVSRTGNSFNGGGMTGQIQKVDWNNNIIWDFVYSTTQYCAHHDITPLPNGNVLIIAYELKTPAEATAAGSSMAITIWSEKVIEVQPTGLNTGDIVWEWHVWDHLVQNVDSTKANYQTSIIDHPELLNINYGTKKDWMHMNGIDYNPLLDQIVVSSHYLNEMYVIDHSTTSAEAAGHTGGRSGKGGDFLYRWGNPAAYQAPGTTNFNVIHDSHWVPMDCPRANSLVGYNNDGISANQSCVDIFYPPYDGYNYLHTAGTAYDPVTYDWRHACNGHNHDLGNSQQLPNGNMLVCVAQSGYIYEIDSNQNILWSKSVTGTTPHAYRYTACYIAGTQPTTPLITMYDDTLTSSTVAATYVWYFNGVMIQGATDQSYVPTANGSYQVKAIDGGGCESEISFPYSYLSLKINDKQTYNKLNVFPNPSDGLITIEGAFSWASDFDVIITDVVGKVISQSRKKSTFDLSGFERGLYHVIVKTQDGRLLTQKVLLMK